MKDEELIMKIKQIINLSGMSASAFANKIGFNQSNLSKMLRGERKISRNLIVAILENGYATFDDFVSTNANEFIVGEDSMLGSDGNIQTVTMSGNNTSIQQAVNVPSISYTHGRPYFNVDFLGGFDIIINDQTVMPEYNIDFKPYNKEGVMWCNITGHSMDPLVSNGDIIAIKEMKDWRDFILYGEVYGIVTEDMRTVKVVTKSEQGQDFMRLVPINKSEEYQPQDIPVKLITHVFKVVGCMKKMW